MGLFDSFKSIVRATVDTAILPVEIVKDVVTGDIILEDELDSVERVKKIAGKLQDAYDEIDD
jgi:hypothetical protein